MLAPEPAGQSGLTEVELLRAANTAFRAQVKELTKVCSQWRNEAKGMEQAFMVTRDDYSELARALGFPGDSFWGDPVVPHEEIVKEAKKMAEQARMYRRNSEG